MYKFRGQMDKGGHYDVEIKGRMDNGGNYDVEMKGWMEKGCITRKSKGGCKRGHYDVHSKRRWKREGIMIQN